MFFSPANEVIMNADYYVLLGSPVGWQIQVIVELGQYKTDVWISNILFSAFFTLLDTATPLKCLPGTDCNKPIDPFLIPFLVPFRTLSTLQNATIPLASQPSVVSKERAREFMSYFPDVVREVMERVKKNSNPEIANHVVRVRNK